MLRNRIVLMAVRRTQSFFSSKRPHIFAAALALWNFSVLLESADQTSLVSYNIKYEKLFGLQDPYMELTGGAFGCGRDCHGTGCLELSHDEFRFRQHLFIPGQRFIGDNAARASG